MIANKIITSVGYLLLNLFGLITPAFIFERWSKTYQRFESENRMDINYKHYHLTNLISTAEGKAEKIEISSTN
jgi:hypothetical protein